MTDQKPPIDPPPFPPEPGDMPFAPERRGYEDDRRGLSPSSDVRPPPGGVERRQNVDRRKLRAAEGRERYLDMVQRERVVFQGQGVYRSTDQLLDLAGVSAVQTNEMEEEGIRESATGDQLRAGLPVQSWLPLSIHLISLKDRVLTVAPLNDLNDRQVDALISTANRSGFLVDRIEVELWDRAELMGTLRRVHDLSADRCEKTLAVWLSDVDNGLLLNQFQRDMLAEALQMHASDIHLIQDNNPEAPNWVRYRVNGDMIPMHLLPPDAMARLTTLIKRDAGLNFGDRVTPKDGRFSFMWQGRNIDVRVAAGPQAQDGEKITLRLLDKAALKGFDELFKRHEDVGEFLAANLSPEIKGGGGLIMLSGPTGSGKTTTLYACVQQIDRRRKHILTIEDPIEYELRYTTQWQVRPGMPGGEFADLIRAAMRHDPDYIVIGEMRDGSTVETALKAAESGHTVISTVHADTAVQTFERLRSLIPAERDRSLTFTLAQQVRAILNQRLVKTLCQGCSHRSHAGKVMEIVELQTLGVSEHQDVRLHNPSGCDLCNRTGIGGRTLLLDALLINLGPSQRNGIYEALINNVNTIIDVPGVTVHSRREGLVDLVRSGLVDPRSALLYLES
jgi:type II secretory ATPase GspE/PulE/Tfp pilus assembly ATPase PilB-like protein